MERAANGNPGEAKGKYMKEKIREIEIGVGWGGKYLTGISSEKTGYYCIDKEITGLRVLKDNNSNIHVIAGNAEKLPFCEEAFDSIVILFPDPPLLAPGLQSYIPISPLAENKKELKSKIYSDAQWYNEFARVLKDGGTLEIQGDWMLLPEEIEKKSKPFFTPLGDEEKLEDYKLEALGTSASHYTVKTRVNYPEAPAYKLIFKKKRNLAKKCKRYN